MSLHIYNAPVPLRTVEGGGMRVGNTRVSLESIIYNYKNGATAEQIVFDFPTLELADVHAVIAYYLRHQDEVENYLVDRLQQAEEVRRQIEPIVSNEKIRERLLTRQRAQDGNHVADSSG